MVLDKKYPSDIRVNKEARSLLEAGHQVHLLAFAGNHGNASHEEEVDGIMIRRVTIHAWRAVFTRLLTNFKLLLPSIERRFGEQIREFVLDRGIDVLHVHDLPMLGVTLSVASKLNIPVVADLHENMPAAFVAYRLDYRLSRKLIDYITANYHVWRWVEAKWLKKCARVIVVVPEAAERLQAYGIEDEKVEIVSNTEDETTFRFNSIEADREIINRYENEWVISYIGGVGGHRGLDTVMSGIRKAAVHIPNLRLLIVGAQKANRRKLRRLAHEIGINGRVDIYGWQPFSKVSGFILASKVCLIPHEDLEHTHTTVPHKLFQYMICKRPVLVSDCKPLKRIVGETKAGVVFRAGDSSEMAKHLAYMYDHPDELSEMAENGHSAALGKYAWRHDALRLVDVYKRLKETD
jgi:glycosyltransferase involved in cell wall biosynthesis